MGGFGCRYLLHPQHSNKQCHNSHAPVSPAYRPCTVHMPHLSAWPQEDGTAAAVRSFHRSLPLDKLLSGERVEWDLAAPQVWQGLRPPPSPFQVLCSATDGTCRWCFAPAMP